MNNKDIEGSLCVELENFMKNNHDFLNNDIIKSFLEIEENKRLLINVICVSTHENNEKLDIAFKKFYFNIRFTSFVSNTLYFNAVNYDKRYRKTSRRHPLSVDRPLGDEENSTFKDIIVDTKAEIQIDDFLKSSNIEDFITDPILSSTLKRLSIKQKQVIDLAYVEGLSDTDIGKRLGKSQQAISKLHKKALEQIHKSMTEKGGCKYDCY